MQPNTNKHITHENNYTTEASSTQFVLTLDRPGGGITERADGVALNGSGDLLQHRDLTQIGITVLHLVQDGLHPTST